MAIMVIMVLCFCSNGATNVVPGLVLYGGLEHLSGKLVFLAGEQIVRRSYPGELASIYEFNLANGVLEKIADAPAGDLIVSDDGSTFCIITHDPGSAFGLAKAFVYSKGEKNGVSFDLSSFPAETVVLKNCVFFIVRDEYQNKILLNYDLTKNAVIDVMPSRGVCYLVHLAIGSPGVIHFRFRDRAVKHAVRHCAYDISSGVVRDMASSCSCVSDRAIKKSADGKFVFLRGSDPPLHGRDLVSTQRTPGESKDCAINEYSVKLIKRLPGLSNGDYSFLGLDHSCKYAFVESEERVFRWFKERWLKRYYFAVNIVNGATIIVAEDRLEHDSRYFCRGMKWVP